MHPLDRRVVIERPDDETVALMRRMSPQQRLAVANDMWRYARDRILIQLQHDHPDWSQQQISHALCERMLGPDAFPATRRRHAQR
jgi:hypothetical protein